MHNEKVYEYMFCYPSSSFFRHRKLYPEVSLGVQNLLQLALHARRFVLPPLRSLLPRRRLYHLMSVVWVGQMGSGSDSGFGSDWVQCRVGDCIILIILFTWHLIYYELFLLTDYVAARLEASWLLFRLGTHTLEPWDRFGSEDLMDPRTWLTGLGVRDCGGEMWICKRQLRMLANQLACHITVRSHNYPKLHETVPY